MAQELFDSIKIGEAVIIDRDGIRLIRGNIDAGDGDIRAARQVTTYEAATTYTGDLNIASPYSLQLGGTTVLNSSRELSVVKVTSSGSITGTDLIAGSANYHGWTSRARLYSPADGIIELTNAAGSDFTRLQLGGTTSSFPSIKRNGAAVNFRLADDSAAADITAGAAAFTGAVAVGATDPLEYKLYISGTQGITENVEFTPAGLSNTAQTNAILMRPIYSGTSRTSVAWISLMRTSSSPDTYDGEIAFSTRATGSALAEAVRIDHHGDVGIGTPSPSGYKLYVNGTQYVNGAATFTGTVSAGSGILGVFDGRYIYRNATDQSFTLYGSSNGDGVTWIKLYGETHATLPNKVVIGNSGSASLTLDSDHAATFSSTVASAGVASHWYPSVTDTYDLGTSTKLWRKGWLSELDTVLFSQNTITLLGGWFYVTKDQGILPTELSNVATTYDFGKTMTPNDFVVFRAGGQVEYIQIGSNISGTNYNITRDKDGSGANTWIAGSCWASLGYNGTGRLELKSGSASGDTRISLITQGTAYNTQTELLRAGDLDGNWGYSGTTYGFAVGEYAASKNSITVDATNGIRLFSGTTVTGQWTAAGGIVIGEVAASKGNISISSGALALRVNTTANITLNTDGTATFAGSITSSATITGGTIQTAASSQRIIITSGSSGSITFYNSTVGADSATISAIVASPNTTTGIDVSPVLTIGGFSSGIIISAGTGIDLPSSTYLTWAGDTNLYRSAANTLKTDDSFVVGATLTAADVKSTIGGSTASVARWRGKVHGTPTNVNDGDLWEDIDAGPIYIRSGGSSIALT